MIAALVLALASAVTPQQAYATASATCAAFPLRSTGTIYYYCDCQTGAQNGCVAGDDANAGTSPAAPRRTWANAMSRFASMTAGSTVAFCKGGAVVSSASYVSVQNTNCTVGSTAITDPANTGTCDMRDYSPPWGGTARPIVRQTATSNLVNLAGPQQGFRFLNIDFEGSGDGPGGGADVGDRGINWDDGATDVFVCGNLFNGWFLALAAYPYDRPIARSLIRGNTITLSALDAFLGGGDDLTIDANYFDNNGGSGSILWHTIYVYGLATHRVAVTNNVINHTTIPCSGADISFHDQMDYVNIENNYVSDTSPTRGPSCWSISVIKGDYGNAEYFRHVTIHRNVIDFGGYTALSVGEAPDAIIENNVIISRGTNYPNLISIPGNAHRTSPADDEMTRGVIRNNTIYVLGNGNAIVVPSTDFPNTDGTGYVIANNSIWYASGTGTCFVTGMTADRYAFVGNNACNGTWGTTYDGTPHITANPLYTSPPTDFRPQVNSPLRDAGSSTYAPTFDFNHYARVNPPDIGAYEYGSTQGANGSLSAATSTLRGTPQFSLSGDTTQVILSTIISGARIYYCTGPTACVPSRSTATRYSAPLTVTSGQTVCGRVWKGLKRYPISCSTYTVN